MEIIKRDGRKVPFNQNKIIDAVLAAFKEVDGEVTDYAYEKAGNIADYIQDYCQQADHLLQVEEIQDLVEKGLMATKRKDVAKAYIIYREERNKIRGNLTDKTFLEFLSGKNEYWNTENSNKDAQIVSVQRDYIAGISSTDIARRFLLPKEVCEAHDAGIIHQHDMDYMAQRALTNCCLINLEDMLQNGTVINGVQIDPQHRITTASTVATQIITAVASSQYGGCTITLSHLAPFVRKSYEENYKKGLKFLNKKEAKEFAEKETAENIKDAVQTFNYQINSMSTTNGQAPFLSVFMWANEIPEYKKETAALIEEFLKQRIKGMKNEKGVYITVAFPKLLYVLDENNITEDSEFWYLTELAAKCTAKRLVPDYISAKKMREYKISPTNNTADVYGCMGCRSFLTPDRCSENWAKAGNYKKGKSKYWGRFNMGVTTINLADVAFSSNKDFNKFWELMEERCELCHKGLQARIQRLETITSDVAPIMWQYGALARLDKGESLHNLIYHGYSTASLGFAALYECVKYMTGELLSEKNGKKFGLKVMQFLNDKCSQWKTEEDIDYSVYGSPIENTTYKFAKTLKKRFGDDIFIKLDGHDRAYVTNSYHYPVFEPIDAFSKLELESEFQKLAPGGAISYIETANMQNNIEAVLSTIKFIYDHIMYAELNTKSDYCQKCGYDGEILVDENMQWYCPNCGNTDQRTMNVARRTCGYIGSHYWSYGRTQEIKDRIIHLGE